MLKVKPGRNVWLLGRTDRDAPTASDAEQTGAAWLTRLWRDEITLPPGQELPNGGQRYYPGAARPLDMLASQQRPTLEPSSDAWRHETDASEAYAVRADRPWYVLADFDWRGPTRSFEEWPHRSIDLFGFPQEAPQDLDWLLLEARAYGAPTRRDSSYTRDVLQPGISAAGVGLSGLALLALALLFLRK